MRMSDGFREDEDDELDKRMVWVLIERINVFVHVCEYMID